MKRRSLAAISAGVFAVLTVLAMVANAQPSPEGPEAPGVLSAQAPSGFAGSAACMACHETQGRLWAGSDHARAMAPAAESTILGDFGQGGQATAPVQNGSSQARFSRRGAGFTVESREGDAPPGPFDVSYAFGWYPLQQYLVRVPDGRLQALPWAWDSRPVTSGGQRWFHVYGDEPIPPSDPRHWTRHAQTWNHMCAECHSTAVEKRYDPGTQTYRTAVSEISVGCEACHGAGAAHVAWVRGGKPKAGSEHAGFTAVANRRPDPDWSADPLTGSPRQGVARPTGDEVETCARYHARRGLVAEGWVPGRSLGDTHLPAFISPDQFEDDGQMNGEVFNDQSFRQSLMFARGVVCSDCHEVHSGKLKAAGTAVCAQCHQPQRFAEASHTGHAGGAGSPDCIDCHMPARTYMVVDRRHDHSFRIPRPDLTVTLGTPNTCTGCHADRNAAWAATAVEAWHGPVRKGHQTYATAFHAARLGDPAARDLLLALVRQPAVPAVARAQAVMLLGRWPSLDTDAATLAALADPDPQVRLAALRISQGQPAGTRRSRGLPALSDPVRIVRLEAALLLADQTIDSVDAAERDRLAAALGELEASYALSADLPEGRAALGLLRERQGRLADAEVAYRQGLALEPGAAAIAANLADIYRLQGREADAETTLRAALQRSPDAAILHHALGLGLVRTARMPEALRHLRQAAEGEPATSRYAFVLAIALRSVGQGPEATGILRGALEMNPSDRDVAGALLQQALSDGDGQAAATLARTLATLVPDDPALARLAARLASAKR